METRYPEAILLFVNLDFGNDRSDPQSVAKKIEEPRFAEDAASDLWPVFETARFDLIEPYGRWESWVRFCGAELPGDVLGKVYFRNAMELLPAC